MRASASRTPTPGRAVPSALPAPRSSDERLPPAVVPHPRLLTRRPFGCPPCPPPTRPGTARSPPRRRSRRRPTRAAAARRGSSARSARAAAASSLPPSPLSRPVVFLLRRRPAPRVLSSVRDGRSLSQTPLRRRGTSPPSSLPRRTSASDPISRPLDLRSPSPSWSHGQIPFPRLVHGDRPPIPSALGDDRRGRPAALVGNVARRDAS